MALHWHGYSWQGHGSDFGRDSARRLTPDGAFRNNELPPLVTGHWFHKPATQIRGTWDEPAEALAWLRSNYDAQPETNGPALSVRLGVAEDALPRGNDVTWAYWLSGGRFLHLNVLSCPRRLQPEIPCPLGR